MNTRKGVGRGSPSPRELECPVCGKTFPRGQLDLNRHINAVTLQHLFTSTQSEDFSFGCNKCELYFSKPEHLEWHQNTQWHSLGKSPTEVVDEGLLSGEEEESEGELEGPVAETEQDTSILVGESEDADGSRTLECMICGKLFPRGPIDLHRHATAITLKHLVSKKRAASFTFGCVRCGLHFTTEDHLHMHEQCSTCNPDMVWPDNASLTAGLRAVNRHDLAQGLIAAPVAGPASPVASKSLRSQVLTPTLAPTAAKTRSSSLEPKREQQPSSATKPIKQERVQPEAETSPARPHGNSLQESRKRLLELVRQDLHHARQKRARIIVPEERQAFFAVVSLLIEGGGVRPDVNITAENYESFIPEKHRELVEKLKSCLLFE